MKYTKHVGIVVLVLLILGVGNGQFRNPVRGSQSGSSAKAAAAYQSNQQAFAIRMFLLLSSEQQDKNLVVSPLGISTTLDALILGSKNKTRMQIEEATSLFDFESKWFKSSIEKAQALTDIAELNMAGGVWIQKDYKIRSTYLEQLLKLGSQNIQNVDFSQADAADKINDWISKQTEQKVKKLIDSVSPETRLVLLNTLVFNGKWKHAFEPDRTSKGYFTSFDGKEIRIPIMQQEQEFAYFKGDRFQTLEMPYEGDRVVMFVLLPEKRELFTEIVKSFSAEQFQKYRKQAKKTKIDVRFPVFTFENRIDLIPPLKTLGIQDMFSDSADFSLIADGQELMVSQLLQGVYIKVDEKGTQAAAATEAMFTLKSAPAKRLPTFYADRPFVYLIVDNKTDTILFMGQVVNPKSMESGTGSVTLESPASTGGKIPNKALVKKEITTSINNAGIGGQLE